MRRNLNILGNSLIGQGLISQVGHNPRKQGTKSGEKPRRLSISQILSFWTKNSNNRNEEFWQTFFSNNPQIIALMFPNPVVKIGEKCYLGGKGINNKGGNLVDFLFKNKLTNSTLIVEIKTPGTPLLEALYRANSYSISCELSGAVVQTLNYRTEIQKNFYALSYQANQLLEVIEPQGVIICGNASKELLNQTQTNSFELFRNNLKNVSIVTYDELFAKLQAIKDFTT